MSSKREKALDVLDINSDIIDTKLIKIVGGIHIQILTILFLSSDPLYRG
jgi:hypothetical protein